jgi:hypothetical protein
LVAEPGDLLSDPFPCAPVLQDSDYFVELWGARAFPSRLFVAEQRTYCPSFGRRSCIKIRCPIADEGVEKRPV